MIDDDVDDGLVQSVTQTRQFMDISCYAVQCKKNRRCESGPRNLCVSSRTRPRVDQRASQ
jgi:hypothetical protein